MGAAPQEKAVLDVAPTLQELGSGWTTNIVAYLLDPLSNPPEIDYHGDVRDSPLLEYQRDLMAKTSRTGCGMLLYGRSNLVMNSGLYRVHIQRWSNHRALHNAWVGYKMDPTRVVRDTPAIGEDLFWTNDWWRETLVGRNLVFYRGLFHVVVEAGADSELQPMIHLAQVIDAKITRKAPTHSQDPPTDPRQARQPRVNANKRE